MQFEEVILRGLTTDEDYTRAVTPYLKKEYFANKSDQALYLIADSYFRKYHKCASKEVLLIEVEKLNYLNESLYADTIKVVNKLESEPINSDRDWLVSNTEEFVKDRALHLAFQKSLEIYKGSDQKLTKTAIPEIMSEALAVSFDTKLGHDYIDDFESQLEYYHSDVIRIPTGTDILDDITNGGIPRKTLSLLIAGCVDENTQVKIRFDNQYYRTIQIRDIAELLDLHKVEISSPDGWVTVDSFVEKGIHRGYKCTNLNTGDFVIVNGEHLFETTDGWEYTKDLSYCYILTETNEYTPCYIESLDSEFRIVDIQVDHPNRRYYANGFSSHNTHVGKSLTMCALAGDMYSLGYNILYITLEESEQKIRQRIDANLLDMTMDDLIKVDKTVFRKRIKAVHARTQGKLKVKEYPTASASASTFRNLLKEYEIKEGFKPDVVFVDYLNICLSDRMRSSDNSNTYMKAITEELRGLAVEFDLSLISSMQINRTGVKNSDPGMDDVADSFASVFVGDFVCVLTAPDELREKNMMMWKQEKNRYKNLNYKKRFITGSDPNKMRIYDVEEHAQPFQDIDTPVFDTTNTSLKLKAEKFGSFSFDDA